MNCPVSQVVFRILNGTSPNACHGGCATYCLGNPAGNPARDGYKYILHPSGSEKHCTRLHRGGIPQLPGAFYIHTILWSKRFFHVSPQRHVRSSVSAPPQYGWGGVLLKHNPQPSWGKATTKINQKGNASIQQLLLCTPYKHLRRHWGRFVIS